MYGLSGASGITILCKLQFDNFVFIILFCYNTNLITIGLHCCLWCLIPKEDLLKPKKARGLYPKRTLESLKEHHQKFKDLGSNLKKAKQCYNVIGEAVFDIPLNRVRNYAYVMTLYV